MGKRIAPFSAAQFMTPRSRDSLSMTHKPIDPTSLPPWKRKRPPGKSHPLSAAQLEAARTRAAQAGRRYPNLVDNMWAARNVARGEASEPNDEDE